MSPAEFQRAWAATGRAEQGYANNPLDKGGETMWGITIAVARAHWYTGPMRDLPKETATQIAKAAYWDIMKLDDVATINEEVAKEMFDTGFLCGVGMAGLFLQRALNSFNRDHRKEGPDYPEVKEDGVVGAMSVHSLRLYMAKRGKAGAVVMLRSLNSQQGVYLMNTKQEEFLFGWFLNRVVI